MPNRNKIIKVGLKANSAFLFSQMKGNTLGGRTGGVFHSSVVFLNESQFETFKTLIGEFDYNVENSLVKTDSVDVDFSCYLKK